MNFYTLNSKENYISKYQEISSYDIEIKKSKFIAYIYKISSNEEALKYLELIKKENKSARHICYIYSYLNLNKQLITKYDEDNEPQGTVAKPIISLLDTKKITNVCIVLVRYFGGILLGSGPLTRAYFSVTNEALKKCNTVNIIIYKEFNFSFNYASFELIQNKIKEYLEQDLIKILKIDYADLVNINILIDQDKETEILDIFRKT